MEIKVNVNRLIVVVISLMIYFCAMVAVSYALYQVGAESSGEILVEVYNPEDVSFVHEIYGQKFSDRITTWDLSDIEVDDKITSYVKYFTNLKIVDFGNQKIDDDILKQLIDENPKIEFRYRIYIENKSYSSLISHLDLAKSKIKDYDELIKKMELLPNLKSADFSNSNLSNEQLGHLRELFPGMEIHWIVHLGRWSVKTDAVSFSVLIYAYDYKRMTSKDIEVLKYCTKLQALDLGHQAITDISVIGEYLKDLRILILADNRISDITPIKELKHLHYLELFINPISDITPLNDLKGLVDVNFCYCWNINDYSTLKNLPNLERVWLVGTRINGKVVNELRSVHPNAQIVNTGAGSTNSGWRTHERYYEMIKMYRNPYYLSKSFTKYDVLTMEE